MPLCLMPLCFCVDGRFLGKVISEYMSVCIREGEKRVSILHRGFNYDRWARTCNKSKQVILRAS